MLDLAGGTTVYLACGATDLRKSYHGLAAIIKLKFKLDPYSRCMFAFCNRRRTSIKILQWDGSGFWILIRDFALKNKSPCSACEFQAKQGISILGIKLLFFLYNHSKRTPFIV